MTHRDRIERMLIKTSACAFKSNAWGARHCAAWHEPQPIEEPIVRMVEAVALYADRHQARFGSKVGDDGVLGDYWQAIIQSVIGLLNGECGRLDCGTVDGLLREMLDAEGLGEE